MASRSLLLIPAVVGTTLLALLASVWLLRGARAPQAEPRRSPGVERGGGVGTDPRRAVGARTEVPGRRAGASPAPAPVVGPQDRAWPLREPPVVDGPQIESHYASGQPEFLGTQVRDAEGRWVRDGPWTAWYESGQLCEVGAYREGLEHGPWDWYYEDGTRMASGSWVDGKRVGEWTFWHEGGELGSVGSYVDGVGAGVWTLYHENGLKWAEGPWSNGEPNGFWRVWLEDGTVDLEGTGTYVDGVKVD